MMTDRVDLTDLLRKVGLRIPSAALHALLAHATKNKLGPPRLLEELVAAELREREARNLARRTRLACLSSFKSLDQFDWAHPRNIDRGLYDHLLDLDFVAQGQNILFRGQAGVGKTLLSQHLAQRALERGLSVHFCTLSAALADLLRQESIPATERRLKRYLAPALLVLDELGYVPSDTRAADLFYNIVTRRHEHRSIVITTNLAFKQWGSVFHDASCLGALVDRFAQHCHVMDIDADSWRDKHSIRRALPTPASPKAKK